MSRSYLCFMDLYTKYKPHQAIQVSQKEETGPLFVGSLDETDKSPTEQEE